MNKKGDISIGIIISAAIALIVLIVVVAIFAGYFSGYTGKIDSGSQLAGCTSLKSTNASANFEKASWEIGQCKTGYSRIYVVGDSKDYPGQICCIHN